MLMVEETVIPETEVCWKHVKKCSGSIVKAATETWKTIMYPLMERRIIFVPVFPQWSNMFPPCLSLWIIVFSSCAYPFIKLGGVGTEAW